MTQLTLPTSAGTVPWPAEAESHYRASGFWLGHSLWHVLAERAKEHADDTAIVDGEVRLSYREAFDRAEAAAVRLHDLGFRPDDRILVQLPNGWAMAILVLACLRAGYVPVMALPAQRESELIGVANHAEARAIAVAGSFRDVDFRSLAQTVAAGTPSVEMLLVSGDVLEGEVSLDDLLRPSEEEDTSVLTFPDSGAVALFLQSGGTTGAPKLIARTHDDYELNIRECAAVAALTKDSVYLVVLPAGHNFPLACPGFLGALAVGGKAVFLPSPSPSAAFAAIEQERVTHVAVVPAVAQRWLEVVEETGDSSALETLQVLQVGGSRLPDEIASRIRPVLGCTLQQVFGMAEGLINMTRLDDPEEAIIHTQGRPVCEADEVRVVGQEDGRDRGVDEPGLILTRGPYTPRGYYAAPAANERAFLEGWYSSGDIVCRRADGNLVVLGRDKDIINRGGEKISAEEIESLSYRLEEVQLAAAVAMPDQAMGERLCLYVVLHPGSTLTLDRVRASMEEAKIATFKLPERLEVVEEIPLTKVGKIDKKALRDDIRSRMASASES
ncbi:MAG: (2,3-dihydroxybenzoyl)adenylate synthase [Pseudoclavibacter sp.]